MYMTKELKMLEKYEKITKDTHRANEYFTNELCYSLGPSQLKEMIKDELTSFNLVDVRPYEDYIDGHIPFATHVPYLQLEENFNKFSKDKINVLYSGSPVCFLAKLCAVKLTEHGYPVMELRGGFKGWKKHGFDVVKDSANMG